MHDRSTGKRAACCCLLIMLFILIGGFLAAAEAPAETPVKDGLSSDIWLVNDPVVYGEDQFVERIQRIRQNEHISSRKDDSGALGLVLSGGSARAFAHIGVLEYLEEQGIVPDFIVSNSMGSIVGLLYAAGLAPSQIHALFSRIGGPELFSLQLPGGGGFIDVSNMKRVTSQILDYERIEEFPIPIMIICEDLRTKREIRITEGDFLTVLQAAYALPVYFDPVPYRGHLLIDGGISNLVPVSAAERYGSSIVASTTFYQNPDLNLSNPLTILNVAMDINKGRRGVDDIENASPYLVRCDVEDFSFMSFDRLDELVQAGYRSAAESEDLRRLTEELQKEGETVEHDLTLLRQEYQLRIEKTLLDFSAFNYLPPEQSPGNRLQRKLYPTVEQGNSVSERRELDDVVQIGIGGSAEIGRLMMRAAAGPVFSLEQGGIAVHPGISGSLRWFPVPWVSAAAAGRIYTHAKAGDFLSELLTGEDRWYELLFRTSMQHFYGAAGVTAAPFRTLGGERWELHAGIEQRKSFQLEDRNEDQHEEEDQTTQNLLGENSIVSGEFRYAYPVQYAEYDADGLFGTALFGRITEFRTGYQLFDFSESALHGSAAGALRLSPAWEVSAEIGGRISLSRGQGIPLLDQDAPYMQWDYGHDFESGLVPAVGWNHLRIMRNFTEFRPSFAEMFLVKNAAAGPYAETVWAEDMLLWGAGIHAGSEISLIGLKTYSVSLHAGYDSGRNGFTAGIAAGL